MFNLFFFFSFKKVPLGKAVFITIYLYCQSKFCSVVHSKMTSDYMGEKGSVQTPCLTVLIPRKPYLPRYNKLSFQALCLSFTILFRIV